MKIYIYIRDMEKHLRFHLDVTEEENEAIKRLSAKYAEKLGVKVSKHAAAKLAIMEKCKKEGVK